MALPNWIESQNVRDEIQALADNIAENTLS